MKEIIRLQKGPVKSVIDEPYKNMEQVNPLKLALTKKMTNMISVIKAEAITMIASRHKIK